MLEIYYALVREPPGPHLRQQIRPSGKRAATSAVIGERLQACLQCERALVVNRVQEPDPPTALGTAPPIDVEAGSRRAGFPL